MIFNQGLNVLVNYARAVGINASKKVDVTKYVFDKRSSDSNMAIHEGSLVTLDVNGKTQHQEDFSAGISVIFDGMTLVDKSLVLYGTIGGEPAISLH
jgi:hypothetical protein